MSVAMFASDQSAPTRTALADDASRPSASKSVDMWHIHNICSGWRNTQT